MSRKPGLPLNCASPGDSLAVSRARGLALITRARASFPFMRASHAWNVSGSKSSLSPRVLSHAKSEAVPATRGEESRQPESPRPCLENGVHIREERAGSGRQHPHQLSSLSHRRWRGLWGHSQVRNQELVREASAARPRPQSMGPRIQSRAGGHSAHTPRPGRPCSPAPAHDG